MARRTPGQSVPGRRSRSRAAFLARLTVQGTRLLVLAPADHLAGRDILGAAFYGARFHWCENIIAIHERLRPDYHNSVTALYGDEVADVEAQCVADSLRDDHLAALAQTADRPFFRCHPFRLSDDQLQHHAPALRRRPVLEQV